MAAPVVPYNGSPPKGLWALAVKRALSHAGFMMWADFTKNWGEYAIRACKNFEHAHGIKVTGKYPLLTHQTLVKTRLLKSRSEWAWQPYDILLARQSHIDPHEEAQLSILDGVTWAIAHQAQIGYRMLRPYPVYNSFPVNHWFWNDCSGMYAQWLRWGDAPDPHRGYYNGYGNTATLWEYGTPVANLRSAELCDAVLYGKPWLAGAAAHVVILRRYANGVWYAGSHGTESGPNEVRADYRSIVGIRRFPLAH